MKMELYQCSDCESHYAVTPTVVKHSCPFCHEDAQIIEDGYFKRDEY
jgi:predicted RNA-binding Zn-ribbon protein involved in translation (DUF1610 family)